MSGKHNIGAVAAAAYRIVWLRGKIRNDEEREKKRVRLTTHTPTTEQFIRLLSYKTTWKKYENRKTKTDELKMYRIAILNALKSIFQLVVGEYASYWRCSFEIEAWICSRTFLCFVQKIPKSIANKMNSSISEYLVMYKWNDLYRFGKTHTYTHRKARWACSKSIWCMWDFQRN